MIREYMPSDIEEVKELGKLLDGSFNITNICENEKIYIYEKDNKVVGFIIFSKVFEVADLTYIVVDPGYRRLGIGRELIKKILKDSKISRIMLEVRESNIGAIRFYESNGFTILRTILNYYGNENAIAMERKVR